MNTDTDSDTDTDSGTKIWIESVRVADGLIAFAYFMIPLMMLYYRRKFKMGRNIIVYLFMAFILSCGITHALTILNHGLVSFYILGGVKWLTAIISLLTMVAMTRELPRLARLQIEISQMDKKLLTLSNYIFHEIRTPFTNFRLGIEELQNIDGPMEKDGHMILKILEDSLDYTEHILNDVLELNKMEVGMFKVDKVEFQVQTLIDIVAPTYRHQARNNGIAFQVITNKLEYSWIRGDCQRLAQVLTNLLSNAFKYTKEGSVKLILNYDSERQLFYFKVKDTGRGMDEKGLRSLFQPYHQVHKQCSEIGTGLGLVIAKNIAKLHEGDISVESQVDRGSVFTLFIKTAMTTKTPSSMEGIVDSRNIAARRRGSVFSGDMEYFLQSSDTTSSSLTVARVAGVAGVGGECDGYESVAGTANDTEHSMRSALDSVSEEQNEEHNTIPTEELIPNSKEMNTIPPRARILVVDDNRAITMLTSRYLNRANIETATAKNGEEALKLLLGSQHPLADADNTPKQNLIHKYLELVDRKHCDLVDLIILDKNMPRMDGLEMTKRFRMVDSKTPIIILSGGSESTQIKELFKEGANDVLIKPISKQDLAKIRDLEWLKDG